MFLIIVCCVNDHEDANGIDDHYGRKEWLNVERSSSSLSSSLKRKHVSHLLFL